RSRRSATGAPRRCWSTGGQRDAAWSQQTHGRDLGNGARRRRLDVCRSRRRRPAQGRAQYRLGGRASQGERHLGLCSDLYGLACGCAFARISPAGIAAADDHAGCWRQIHCALRAGTGNARARQRRVFWDGHPPLRHDVQVAAGLAVTAALFEIGKLLIGLYIGKQALESTYGAAASLVVLLIWVYYSSQLVLMGAEFTRVYAKRRALSSTSSSIDRPIEPHGRGVDRYVQVAVRGSPYAAAIMALLLGGLFGRLGDRNQRAGRTS